MITKDLSPFSVYLATDQLSVIKNLFEVDSKNFNLMTWHFTKESMSCTTMNEIETIITENEMNNFDEYVVNDLIEITVEPKEFYKKILKGHKKKDIMELMIEKNNPKVIKVVISDSGISNFDMTYFFYASNQKPKVATTTKIDYNLSFIIQSKLFHSTIKILKDVKSTFELVVKENCIYLKCIDDFKVNVEVKIGENEKSLLFSEEEMQKDVVYSFGHFYIDTFVQFQKLINFSHTIEVRLLKKDKEHPLILIYDIGNIGKKHLLIRNVKQT